MSGKKIKVVTSVIYPLDVTKYWESYTTKLLWITATQMIVHYYVKNNFELKILQKDRVLIKIIHSIRNSFKP